ncbi:unnamed protein product [Cylindrotheca closterium]|uniref:RING-type domain-containing protein n=1 Tax=Cylindrotheca closterium TaxID=2856 RepID=A0AAD2FPE7_9STRA|nr:unnamed protein product [Cylindrotheca closterium]
MLQSASDNAIHRSLVRQLQNCTSSDDGCTNDSASLVTGSEDESSSTTSLILILLLAVIMVFSGLRVFCVDIPRDRKKAREKARCRQDLIENRLIKKRVKRPPLGEKNKDDHDEEKGFCGVVPSPRNCRLHKVDLILPMPKDDGGVDHEEELFCPICWAEYEENDEICYSQNPRCTHTFHFDCIKPWLKNHDRCPICRSNYLRTLIDGGGTNYQSLDTPAHRGGQDRALRF